MDIRMSFDLKVAILECNNREHHYAFVVYNPNYCECFSNRHLIKSLIWKSCGFTGTFGIAIFM